MALAVSVDSAGRLKGSTEPYHGAPSAVGDGSPPRVAFEGEFPVAGSFGADGSLSGSVERLGLSFSSAGPVRSADLERFSGFYVAGSAGSCEGVPGRRCFR